MIVACLGIAALLIAGWGISRFDPLNIDISPPAGHDAQDSVAEWSVRHTSQPSCPAFPVALIGRGVDIPQAHRGEVMP